MIQLLLLFIVLFAAGWAFGRSLILLPILMALVPFIGHINSQLQRLNVNASPSPAFDAYLALALGLSAILLVIGIVWGYTYPLSAFLFPLLCFGVYMGPWQYLARHTLVPLEPSLNRLLFFTIMASLAILSYLLPMFLKMSPAPKLQPPTLGGR